MKKLCSFLICISLLLLTTQCRVSNLEPIQVLNLDNNSQEPIRLTPNANNKYEIADNVYLMDLSDKRNKIISITSNKIVFGGRPYLINAKEKKNGRASAGEPSTVTAGMVIQFTASDKGLSGAVSANIGLAYKVTKDGIEREVGGSLTITAEFTIGNYTDLYSYIDFSGSVKFSISAVYKLTRNTPSETSSILYSGKYITAGVKSFDISFPTTIELKPSVKIVWSRESGVNVFELVFEKTLNIKGEVNIDLIGKITKEIIINEKDLPNLIIPLGGPFVIPIKQKLTTSFTPTIEGAVNIKGTFFETKKQSAIGVRLINNDLAQINKPSETPVTLGNITLSISGKLRFGLKQSLTWSPMTLKEFENAIKSLGVDAKIEESKEEESISLIDIRCSVSQEFYVEFNVGCAAAISDPTSIEPSVSTSIGIIPALKCYVKIIKPIIDVTFTPGAYSLNITNVDFVKSTIIPLLPCSLPSLPDFSIENFKQLLMSQKFPIYEGLSSPVVNGYYLSSPHLLIKSSLPSDTPNYNIAFGDIKIEIDIKVNSRYIAIDHFYKNKRGMSYEVTQSKEDMLISGTGGNFTILAKTKGIVYGNNNEYSNFIAVSGFKNSNGIRDLQFALYRISNSTSYVDISSDSFRFFKDGDGLAENTQ